MALQQQAIEESGLHSPTAESNVAVRRAALRTESTRAARAALVDALLVLAEEELLRGREAATVTALSEASLLVPKRVPDDPAWRGRYIILNRTKAALAQRQNRQADAIEAFQAALSVIPTEEEGGSYDDNTTRLQLLGRMARSQLALGESQRIER